MSRLTCFAVPFLVLASPAWAEAFSCSEWTTARASNDPDWVVIRAWAVTTFSGSSDLVESPRFNSFERYLDGMCSKNPSGFLDVTLGKVDVIRGGKEPKDH